ncbi:threonylcarbamoyl-AMP synthase [Clostridia bacterium]|nr:threonylcarbamoyl-AMP synthase [Clostridia bacterium]
MITKIVQLDIAASILRSGGLVVFPTETVYGLGASALDADAARRIYEAKGRPCDNPLIVHFARAEDIAQYAVVTPLAERIIDAFLPAPLTLVLKKKPRMIPDTVTAGLDTVAVRVPRCETARELIRLAGFPVAAPSANISGRPSPTTAADAIAAMNGRVDAIISGEDCEVGLESTIISFAVSGEVTLLRAGFITAEQIEEAARVPVVRADKVADGEHPPAPGMKYRHYAPKSPLIILRGSAEAIADYVTREAEKGGAVGFICFGTANIPGVYTVSLGEPDDKEAHARNLFVALNAMDARGVSVIYCADPPGGGIGEAVRERLYKASGSLLVVN